MIDIDWFIRQSTTLIADAENALKKINYQFNDYQDEVFVSSCLFGAWANWLNIRLMVRAGLVTLTEEQEREYDYLKLKFVQHSRFLPEETSNLSLL